MAIFQIVDCSTIWHGTTADWSMALVSCKRANASLFDCGRGFAGSVAAWVRSRTAISRPPSLALACDPFHPVQATLLRPVADNRCQDNEAKCRPLLRRNPPNDLRRRSRRWRDDRRERSNACNLPMGQKEIGAFARHDQRAIDQLISPVAVHALICDMPESRNDL